MIRLTFTCFYASVFACTVFLKILRWETLRIYRSKYIYINLDLSRKFWANLVDDTKAMVKLFRWGWSSFRTKVPLVSDSPKRAAPPLTERERELISRELISTVQAKPKWIKVPHPSPTVASTSFAAILDYHERLEKQLDTSSRILLMQNNTKNRK